MAHHPDRPPVANVALLSKPELCRPCDTEAKALRMVIHSEVLALESLLPTVGAWQSPRLLVAVLHTSSAEVDLGPFLRVGGELGAVG